MGTETPIAQGPGDALIRVALTVAWSAAKIVMASPVLTRTLGRVFRNQGAPSAKLYRIKHEGVYLYAASLDRLLALYLWKYSVLEAYELEVIRSLIVPGSTILDVGANIGFHTLQFARWTGPQGRVYCFEPEPGNFAVLLRNIDASGLVNVTPMQLAVSDKVGTTEMFVSAVHRGDHRIVPTGDGRSKIQVDTTTLDALFSKSDERIGLVKIDVQGAEVLVLDGMRAMLDQNPDAVVVTEFSPALMRDSGQSPMAFIERVRALPYRIRRIDEGRKVIADCDADTLCRLAETEREVNLILTRR